MAGAESDRQSQARLLPEDALGFEVRSEVHRKMSIRTWPKYVLIYVCLPLISGPIGLMGYSIYKEISYDNLYTIMALPFHEVFS